MIRSMTGFGKGEYKGRLGTATVEMRSFNHKFLDITSKLPEKCPSEIDVEVRTLVQRRISRGKINITINYDRCGKDGMGIYLNKELARYYYRELTLLKKALGARDEIGIKEIVFLPHVLTHEDVALENKILPDVKKAAIKALSNLIKMRSEEGNFLRKDIVKRISVIEKELHRIQERIPLIIDDYRKRLKKNMERLSGTRVTKDDKRVVAELSAFASSADISEELTRALCHVIGLKRALSTNTGEAGKVLDFTALELLREVNTMSAKSEDYKVSESVIKVKEEIEKIREQSQNVE